jgi:hypothetical protein
VGLWSASSLSTPSSYSICFPRLLALAPNFETLEVTGGSGHRWLLLAPPLLLLDGRRSTLVAMPLSLWCPIVPPLILEFSVDLAGGTAAVAATPTPSTCYDGAGEVVMGLLVWCYCDAFDSTGAVYFNHDAGRTGLPMQPRRLRFASSQPCCFGATALVVMRWVWWCWRGAATSTHHPNASGMVLPTQPWCRLPLSDALWAILLPISSLAQCTELCKSSVEVLNWIPDSVLNNLTATINRSISLDGYTHSYWAISRWLLVGLIMSLYAFILWLCYFVIKEISWWSDHNNTWIWDDFYLRNSVMIWLCLILKISPNQYARSEYATVLS